MFKGKKAVVEKSEHWNEVFFYFIYKFKQFRYQDSVLKHYNRNLLDIFVSRLLENNIKFNRKIILVSGRKKADFLLKTFPKTRIIVIGSLRDFIFCIKNKLGYLPSSFFKYKLFCAWQNKKISLLHEISTYLIKLFGKKNIVALFVENDSLPFERLLIYCSKKNNILTYCFQHGLFSRNGGILNDGKYADIILCYDKFQARVLKYTGAKKPLAIKQPFLRTSNYTRSDRSTLVFIGQPYVEYYKYMEKAYLNTLEIIKNFCTENNIVFLYKSHPAEKVDKLKYLCNLQVIPYSLSDCFQRYFCFCSISSTALFEATLNKKLAIQIYDSRFKCENYEKFNYAYSVPIKHISKLLMIIQKMKPKKITLPRTKLKIKGV